MMNCPLCDGRLESLGYDVFECIDCEELYTTDDILEYLRKVTEDDSLPERQQDN